MGTSGNHYANYKRYLRFKFPPIEYRILRPELAIFLRYHNQLPVSLCWIFFSSCSNRFLILLIVLELFNLTSAGIAPKPIAFVMIGKVKDLFPKVSFNVTL